MKRFDFIKAVVFTGLSGKALILGLISKPTKETAKPKGEWACNSEFWRTHTTNESLFDAVEGGDASDSVYRQIYESKNSTNLMVLRAVHTRFCMDNNLPNPYLKLVPKG